MYATTLEAAPSHRWRASLVLESEAASAAASTMVAAPAAYSRARSVIVGQTSTSVPATADAVIVAIRAPRLRAIGTSSHLERLEDGECQQRDAQDDPDRP